MRTPGRADARFVGPSLPSGRETRSRKTANRRVLELALIPLLSLAIVFGFVRPFVFEVFRIPSGSMSPTLGIGDHALTNKLAYRLGDPGRGDLVAFRMDGGVQIKRAVGLAGDKVAIRDGVLYVNGRRVREPYVDHRLNDGAYFGPERVPENHVFVMGDNRANSLDSRTYGPIRRDDLIGEALAFSLPSARFESRE